MAIIPNEQKFHTVSSTVDTIDRGSSQANSNREVYTMQDVKESVVGNDIPTPYMYVLKRPYVDATTKNDKAFVAMQKPVKTDWLTKNPRLFMFRYRKSKTRRMDLGATYSYIMKRGNFVHPSHNNGVYQRANFPGSNWASTPQTGSGGELFPIPTEWDVNSELKIAKTGSLINDFASLRPTTYIEVPFNPLGFLYDTGLNPTEVTSLPATTTQDFWGTRFSVIRPASNAYAEPNDDGFRTSQIIMKFAIGIPNPTWTKTNHELPYIFGDLSNALMLKYQYQPNNNKIVTNYTITQGSSGPAQRAVY